MNNNNLTNTQGGNGFLNFFGFGQNGGSEISQETVKKVSEKDKKLIEYILDCDLKKSLEYKWYCRNITPRSISDPNLKELIKKSSLSSFEYYNKNKEAIENDKSLSIACAICNCQNTALTTTCVDHSVTELGHYFNEIAGSARGVKMCYDCGTVARAIFLNLINGYRGDLTPKEKKNVRDMYYPSRGSPLNIIEEFYCTIKRLKEHSVFIMSVGLDDFGHVWIFEKVIDFMGRHKVIMYQSSLNSYLLMDYIEYKDMANKKDGINIDDFYRDMKILATRKNWSDYENKLFSKWFQFMPTSYVTAMKMFLFCYISLVRPDY
jgi:hypothetical protein